MSAAATASSTLHHGGAFPNSEFVGIDFHDEFDRACAGMPANGRKNVRFEAARAQDFAGADYDLVTMFDALHDMGDPVGAVAHIRDVLADDGTLMLVEPTAGDSLADNLNPVGRVYYAGSTHICVPTSLDQEVGARSARRPARSASARSCATVASPVSARRRRRPST